MNCPRLVRSLVLAALLLLAGRTAYATPITITVGDKDGFGLGVAVGAPLPCVTALTPCYAPILDWRDSAEQAATNGAHLTDVYSALYDGFEDTCGAGGGLCSPNGATGTVVFPFTGRMNTATITMRIGDFESSNFGAMLANINGVPIPFAYNDGFAGTSVRTITLTPLMLLLANLSGQVTLFLDHRVIPGQIGPGAGSFDYIAFDYFELNGDYLTPTELAALPEPGTWVLLGTGLAVLAARRLPRRR